MTEFLIVSGMAWFMILGTIQLALITNAHTMLKLAAFNAARAAIVVRGNKPDDPVKLQDMRDAGKLAAWFTLLPVMPWVQARMAFQNQQTTAAALQQMMNDARSGGPPTEGSLRSALGSGSLPSVFNQSRNRIANEFGKDSLGNDNLTVKFYRIDNPSFVPGANVDSIPEDNVSNLRFDDRLRARENLVRVVVKWQYPLVIPFADRIICAATPACSQPLGYVQTAVPAWAAGTSLYGKAPAILGAGNPFRIPLYATYVMRMQRDRND